MGRVVFIGAGPGAADLITMRGAQRLAAAQVVLFDALTDPALRELAPHAQWLDVGKRGYRDSMGQARINALLVEQAQQHALVARLKGGDPSIFGRLEEELLALQAAGIDCEVVPGVTSALAAAAATQRPLTRRGRGRNVSLSTAMTRAGTLRASRSADTEVFYMAGHALAELSQRLLAAGWPAGEHVSVVSAVGTAEQHASVHSVQTLGEAAAQHAGQPTVVIVGAGASALDVAEATMDSPLDVSQVSVETPRA